MYWIITIYVSMKLTTATNEKALDIGDSVEVI